MLILLAFSIGGDIMGNWMEWRIGGMLIEHFLTIVWESSMVSWKMPHL